MLSRSLLPTQLVATHLGRCGAVFFLAPLLFTLPLLTDMLLLRICVTCQQKPAAEKQQRGIFFLSFFRAWPPLRQAASLRLLTPRLLAAPRRICQGQQRQERPESIPGRISTMKGRKGVRRPPLISRTSAGFISPRGQKAEFGVDAKIIRCAASADN